jgi:hypothetical protein
LPSHPPQQHFWIEIVGANQTLRPALAPQAHHFNDRPKILSSGRQSIEMTLAPRFRFNVHHPVMLQASEALRQHRPRYQRRGIK